MSVLWYIMRYVMAQVLDPFAWEPRTRLSRKHYNDVIMTAMASDITSIMIVYSTVYSMLRSKKTSKLRVTGLCEGNSPVTGEFPIQRVSNAENVSIWWRYRVLILRILVSSRPTLNQQPLYSPSYPQNIQVWAPEGLNVLQSALL